MREQRVDVRARFWIESVLASLAGGLFLLTVVWHDWLEAFGVDPDGGNGSAEWVAVGVLAACSFALGAAARVEWRRAATTTG